MSISNYLRETIDVIKQIETRFIELGARFYKIKTEELWKEGYDSFNDFLGAAKVNPGNASILVSIHKAYVIDRGVERDELAGIGYSNLYEAIPLLQGDNTEEVLTKARTLTRDEIKDEVREDKHGVCEHTDLHETFRRCGCGKFVRV